MGHNTKARGDYSTALGQTTTARGDYSVAIGSGTKADFLRLTGCVGVMSGNMFAASTAEGGTEITFGATGDNTVPVTMFMAGNYGEFGTGVGAGLVSGEIFRT